MGDSPRYRHRRDPGIVLVCLRDRHGTVAAAGGRERTAAVGQRDAAAPAMPHHQRIVAPPAAHRGLDPVVVKGDRHAVHPRPVILTDNASRDGERGDPSEVLPGRIARQVGERTVGGRERAAAIRGRQGPRPSVGGADRVVAPAAGNDRLCPAVVQRQRHPVHALAGVLVRHPAGKGPRPDPQEVLSGLVTDNGTVGSERQGKRTACAGRRQGSAPAVRHGQAVVAAPAAHGAPRAAGQCQRHAIHPRARLLVGHAPGDLAQRRDPLVVLPGLLLYDVRVRARKGRERAAAEGQGRAAAPPVVDQVRVVAVAARGRAPAPVRERQGHPAHARARIRMRDPAGDPPQRRIPGVVLVVLVNHQIRVIATGRAERPQRVPRRGATRPVVSHGVAVEPAAGRGGRAPLVPEHQHHPVHARPRELVNHPPAQCRRHRVEELVRAHVNRLRLPGRPFQIHQQRVVAVVARVDARRACLQPEVPARRIRKQRIRRRRTHRGLDARGIRIAGMPHVERVGRRQVRRGAAARMHIVPHDAVVDVYRTGLRLAHPPDPRAPALDVAVDRAVDQPGAALQPHPARTPILRAPVVAHDQAVDRLRVVVQPQPPRPRCRLVGVAPDDAVPDHGPVVQRGPARQAFRTLGGG